MKKLLFVILAVIMCVSLVACAAPAAETPASEAPASEAPASEAPASEAPASEAPASEEPAPEESKVFKVAVSLPPADNAWQANFASFLTNLLNEDPTIDATVKSASDNAEQMNVIQTFRDNDYDLIAILPVDGSQLTATCDDVFDSGVPTIICDRDTESDKKTSFVAGDNYDCGAKAAAYVQEFFADKEEVTFVHLRSYAGTPIDLDRYNGFRDIIDKDPKFKFLGEADGEFNSTAGFEAMSNLLSAYDSIDLVYTHDDETTTGALTAIEQMGRTDIQLITGMGGTKTSFAEIKADSGPHKMTAAYLPGFVAQTLYDAISQYLTTGSVDKKVIAPSAVINKDTVDDWMQYAYE